MNKTFLKQKSQQNLIEKIIIGIFIGGVIAFFSIFFYFSFFSLFQYFTIEKKSHIFISFWETIQAISNLEAIVFSIMQGFFSTLLCLIIGFPLSYFMQKYRFPLRKFLKYLIAFPLIMPTSVLIFAIKNSYNTNIYGNFHAIMLIHVFSYLAIILWIGGLSWDNLSYEQIAMAKTLGVSKFKTFRTVIFPQIRPFFASACLLVFAYSFNSFSIILSFGGIKLETLEVRIFKEVIYNHDFQVSSNLVVVQMILNAILVISYLIIEKNQRKILAKGNVGIPQELLIQNLKNMEQSKKNKKPLIILTLTILIGILIIIIYLFPLIKIVFTAFTPFNDNYEFYSGFLPLFTSNPFSYSDNRIIDMIFNSIWLGLLNILISSVISICLLVLFKYSERLPKKNILNILTSILHFFFSYPIMNAAIALSFGLVLQFRNTHLFVHGHNSWLAILLIQTLLCIPITFRILLNTYNKIDQKTIEMAHTLGASRIQILMDIELPQLKKGLIYGAIFAFVLSIREAASSIFIDHQDFPTLASEIYNLLSSSNPQVTASISFLFITIAILTFFIYESTTKISTKTIQRKK